MAVTSRATVCPDGRYFGAAIRTYSPGPPVTSEGNQLLTATYHEPRSGERSARQRRERGTAPPIVASPLLYPLPAARGEDEQLASVDRSTHFRAGVRSQGARLPAGAGRGGAVGVGG